MKRALTLDFILSNPFKSYQLLVLALSVSLLVSIGSKNILSMVVTVPWMYNVVLSNNLALCDDQNKWGLHRLTMPFARRDIVFARYLAIIIGTSIGSLIAWMVALLLTALARFVTLPEPFASTFSGLESLPSEILLCIVVLGTLMTFLITVVLLPISFRFGQSKVTQFSAVCVPLLVVLPPIFLLNLLPSNERVTLVETVQSFLSAPGNVALTLCIALAIMTLLLVISSRVALKLYEKRPL